MKLTNERILKIAEPFGAFEYGDAQGDKRIDFARAIEEASESASFLRIARRAGQVQRQLASTGSLLARNMENAMDLHGQIINICTTREAENAEYSNRREAYMYGHRDARHAAAELALKADAVSDAARKLLDWVSQAAEHYDCINWHAVNADEGAKLRAALNELVSG